MLSGTARKRSSSENDCARHVRWTARPARGANRPTTRTTIRCWVLLSSGASSTWKLRKKRWRATTPPVPVRNPHRVLGRVTQVRAMCVASCVRKRRVRVVLAQQQLLLPLAGALMPTRRQQREPLASARAGCCWWDAFFVEALSASAMQRRAGMRGFTRLVLAFLAKKSTGAVRGGVTSAIRRCNCPWSTGRRRNSRRNMQRRLRRLRPPPSGRQQRRGVLGIKKRVSRARPTSNFILFFRYLTYLLPPSGWTKHHERRLAAESTARACTHSSP